MKKLNMMKPESFDEKYKSFRTHNSFKVPEGFFEKEYNLILEKKYTKKNHFSLGFFWKPSIIFVSTAFVLFLFFLLFNIQFPEKSNYTTNTIEILSDIYIQDTDESTFFDIFLEVAESPKPISNSTLNSNNNGGFDSQKASLYSEITKEEVLEYLSEEEIEINE